jgi:hypothetical protein
LTLITKKKCDDINKILESLPGKSEAFFNNFAEQWENYFLSTLELNQNLSIIADSINEFAGRANGSSEGLSIWKLLVTMFMETVYKKQKDVLENTLVELIYRERCNQGQIEKQRNTISLSNNTIFNAPRLMNLQKLRKLRNYFCILVDMYTNENNVFYTEHSSFLGKNDRMRDFIEKIVENQTNHLYEKWEEENCDLATFTRTIKNDRRIMKKITNSCVWSQLKAKGNNFLYKLTCRKIKSIALEFTKFQGDLEGKNYPKRFIGLDKLVKGIVSSVPNFNKYFWNFHKEIAESYASILSIISKPVKKPKFDIEIVTWVSCHLPFGMKENKDSVIS